MTKPEDVHGMHPAGWRWGRASSAVVCAVATFACAEEPATAPVRQVPPVPVTGSIVVLASIHGKDPDPDGFQVRVDEGSPRTITSESRALFADMTPGEHTVRVDGIAANCALTDPNPRTVFVVAREVTTVVVTVDCLARGTGIRVHVSRGFDRFGLVIGDSIVVYTTDGRIVVGLPAGVHWVRLLLDAGACALDGSTPNPRPVSVMEGRYTDAYFFVYCPLVVRVTTTGPNQPAGYSAWIAQVDDFYCYSSCFGHRVDATGDVNFSLTPDLEYDVSLREVPSNCTASPAIHRVAILAGTRTVAEFVVRCS